MAPNPARVLLADDQDVVIAGMRVLLSAHANYVVLNQHASSGRALDLVVENSRPDVLILDAEMPEFGLLPFVRATREKRSFRVILCTSGIDDSTLVAVSDLVDGILYKGDELGHHLADALRRVLDGHRYLSPLAYDALEIARQRVSMLTPKQLEIAHLMARGWTAPQIALQLKARVGSIYTHQERIRARLGLTSNEAVVAYLKINPQSTTA